MYLFGRVLRVYVEKKTGLMYVLSWLKLNVYINLRLFDVYFRADPCDHMDPLNDYHVCVSPYICLLQY